MIGGIMNFFQKSLASSSVIVKFVLLVRNQCNMIVQYYLINSPNPDEDGENMIVDNVFHSCNNIMDVGANVGEWTTYFLQKNPAVKAILFEPSLSTYNYLLEKFQTAPGVTIINQAVSDTAGETFFFEEPDFGKTSSLISSFSNKQAKQQLVKISTIDSVIEQNNITAVDFLKIDVEGYDFHVLRGASKNLAAKKIKYLQFEYGAPWAKAGSTLINALDFLKQQDYETFLLKKDGLYLLNYNRYGEFFRFANFIATPSENVRAIKHLIKKEI